MSNIKKKWAKLSLDDKISLIIPYPIIISAILGIVFAPEDSKSRYLLPALFGVLTLFITSFVFLGIFSIAKGYFSLLKKLFKDET